jgi:hypothetical protein
MIAVRKTGPTLGAWRRLLDGRTEPLLAGEPLENRALTSFLRASRNRLQSGQGASWPMMS